MQRLLIALLLLIAVSGTALAQGPFIGIYADDVAVHCHADVT
jgi:hypothetical protein